jgi:hypothetical protein
MVKDMEEKVQRIIYNLKEAQARQKSYADKRRKPLYFQVEDYVYLKVSPMKGVSRFRVKGKLAPRYIGHFPILEQCGPVAYRPITRNIVCCAQCVPCVSIEKVSSGSRSNR